MYLNGHLDEADFHSRSLDIRRQLDVLRPSTRPEAGEILQLLENLPLLLKRYIMAHEPFDRWVNKFQIEKF